MPAIGCLIPLLLGIVGGFAGALIDGTRAGVIGAVAGGVVGGLAMLAMVWRWEKVRTPPE